MRIGLVGGHERSAGPSRRLALERGHHLETHSGDMTGPGAEKLRALLLRVDVVVILTDINSHGAVLLARRLARQSGTSVLLVRRWGIARCATLLDALTIHQRRHATEGVPPP